MPSVSTDPYVTTWRSSSYSMGEDKCLEVSDEHPGLIPVRDSKTPTGPTLTIPTPAWSAFITALSAESGLAPR
ncbi:hypothetical protein H340_01894 [Streptomyces mobaraensis NBRC 13819 = DSM 40847]|uniref:DUF397 domain-containing protein n=1 Tax=Streptomyces mobaraensis (strain ATCC 29032 / DSM 40847 / JCM 4168 / NBRC 13819 / NCIMB 11159 / IPCR 16-22) TaxID=1223523 RepID=M3B883_STRM1|nr:DUF397 domain-containing protein [Streptomyces mobaraensis]EMF02213.1 hypothetical protein H340_01894 [Streptomyces mobaraensis NBRC 13819 = DSM 40847]